MMDLVFISRSSGVALQRGLPRCKKKRVELCESFCLVMHPLWVCARDGRRTVHESTLPECGLCLCGISAT